MRLIVVVLSALTLTSEISAFSPAASRARRNHPQRCFMSLDPQNDDVVRSNLGRQLRGLQLKGIIEPGDTVDCKRELSSAGIYENCPYELQSIYAQSFNPSTQQIDRLALANLDTPIPKGYDRYVTLFSPLYHKEPVVVTPEEVGLVSVRSEVVDSVWLAVPGVFWVFVCYNIYNIYHERTGGSFVDAFLGR